ncbi:MAG: primosomal protein N' [Bacteroidia bacterium]
MILPLALPTEYTYRIPQELNEEIAVGKRVVVQFGKKRIYAAVVFEINQNPPNYPAKYVLSVLDDVPVVGEQQLQFWRWVANYYLCTMGEVMNAALPNALKLQSQTKITLNVDTLHADNELDTSEMIIIEKLKISGSLTLDEVNEISKKKSGFKIVESLYKKGIIDITEQLNERYKPKIKKFIRIADKYYSNREEMQALFEKLEQGSTLQLHVLMKLVSTDINNKGVDKNEFIKANGLSPSSTSTLLKNGVLHEFEQVVERNSFQELEEYKINELTENQLNACEKLNNWFEEKSVVLLEGETSSGKTHVYIRLMEEVIKIGGQVLYLLPEISLTTQLIKRIQAYFGSQVLVNHSKFSDNERLEIWQKIREGEATILLAPRSGLFMPFHSLRLIIVDEEHEASYKQMEPAPRYNARDAAIMLAKYSGAKVLLGSATPSMETLYNASIGKYGFVKLEGRYNDVLKPEITIVNMREERKQKRLNGLFSSILLEKIELTLKHKKQVVLFQNRKGYVPVTECTECSWSPKCIHCDITLTYYRRDDKLRCHFCGYQILPINQCPACGNMAMKMVGYGTERVESELASIFQEARIQRLDYESTRTKTALQKIISGFENGEIDILIGTQMITKGFDFENLALVGILDADHSLNFPDFRAFERSFQLFAQVGGRAGRRKEQGEIILQTNQPQHPVIQQFTFGNYNDFYHREIIEREKFHYPPFGRIIKIVIRHKDWQQAQKAAEMLALLLRGRLEGIMLGPEEPHISKIRGLFIRQILIKIAPPMPINGIKLFLSEKLQIFRQNKDYKQVRVTVDVDPQ